MCADGKDMPFAMADNVGGNFMISILSFFTALLRVSRVLRGGGGSKEDGGEPARPADEIVARQLLSETGPWLAVASQRHFWAQS